MVRKRLTLTAAHVESLPAIGGDRTEYLDVIVPELALRVSPHGSRTWSVRFWQGRGRAGRRAVRVTLGPTSRLGLAAARAEARAMLERVSRGQATQPERGLTVNGLLGRCLDALDLRDTTRREWSRLALVEIGPALGSRLAAEVRRADVRQWLRDVGGRSAWTANRAFEVLRRAYSWARREELLEASPCDLLGRPFPEPSSDRVLSRDELRRLLGALDRGMAENRPYADTTRMLLLTGVRRESVLGARREEFEALDDPREARWVVPAARSKSGRQHVVPLSLGALRAVHRRLEAAPGAQLFPVGGRRAGRDEPMTWSSGWVQWLREEMRPLDDGLQPGPLDPRWTIHGLRHTIATHLVEDLGTPRDVVSLILGHALSGPRVTRIYDRAEMLSERRAALERWAEWLERLAEDAQKARILPMRRNLAGVTRGVTHGPVTSDHEERG